MDLGTLCQYTGAEADGSGELMRRGSVDGWTNEGTS
jgi:hypothetical protein